MTQEMLNGEIRHSSLDEDSYHGNRPESCPFMRLPLCPRQSILLSELASTLLQPPSLLRWCASWMESWACHLPVSPGSDWGSIPRRPQGTSRGVFTSPCETGHLRFRSRRTNEIGSLAGPSRGLGEPGLLFPRHACRECRNAE